MNDINEKNFFNFQGKFVFLEKISHLEAYLQPLPDKETQVKIL